MDYGQPVNNSQEADFFTAGVGNVSENLNPDADNSLNTDIYSPNHDLENLGNAAIASSETAFIETSLNHDLENLESPNQPAQVIDLKMPPMTEPEPLNQDILAKTPAENLADMTQIAREDDKISPKTIEAVAKAESDCIRGATSLADLDNFVADATEAYMKTFGGYAKWKGGE